MQDSYRQIWESIAAALKPEVNADTFQRWFAAIALMRADEQTMTLRVPNNIYQLWIESNYMPQLQSAVMSVLGAPRQVKFVFGENDAAPAPANGSTPAAESSAPASSQLAASATPVETRAFAPR